MEMYKEGREEGSFEGGIRMAVQAIIAQPEFIFRFERVPRRRRRRGRHYRICGPRAGVAAVLLPVEQRARRRAARRWRRRASCATPAVLEREVRRMLADRRADSLSTISRPSGCGCRASRRPIPTAAIFPNFTRNLAQSMTPRDQAAVRQHRARGPQHPRPAHRRLHLRQRGAGQALRHPERRRAAVPPGDRSPIRTASACSAAAAILTLTSLANRTSPVRAASTCIEVLLGAPPPPPPANVPPLAENVNNETGAAGARAHRGAPQAAPPAPACHKMMDPIGLALENFDAIGRWRNNDSGMRRRSARRALRRHGARRPGQPARGAARPRRRLRRRLRREPLELRPRAGCSTTRDMPTVRAIVRDARARRLPVLVAS